MENIEKVLQEKGYIQYSYDHNRYSKDHSDKFYQKRFRDGKNTKYFINAYHYVLSHPFTKEDLSGWEYEGQYYITGTHTAVNMKFLTEDIDEVENFIDKLYKDGYIEDYDREE